MTLVQGSEMPGASDGYESEALVTPRLVFPRSFATPARRRSESIRFFPTPGASLHFYTHCHRVRGGAFFVGTIHCCWVAVARQPQSGEQGGATTARRTVRKLKPWAAALGSLPARNFLAELTSNGTINQVETPSSNLHCNAAIALKVKRNLPAPPIPPTYANSAL
jgi:hypothetical protein